jgi:dynein light intermediate chain 1, cytosolic
MREGFDAKVWAEAWERDLEAESDQSGVKALYSALVKDQGQKVKTSKCLWYITSTDPIYFQPHSLPPLHTPTPEQAFLAKNYDENAKKPDRDPRGAFKNPSEMAGSAAAGIVGPLGSSSFNLPNVERALKEMESGTGTALPGNADARRGMMVGSLPSAISDFTLSRTWWCVASIRCS